MAMFTIPCRPSEPNYRMRVDLDGRAYLLDLRWSQREERWYLDLRSSAGDLLAGAIKLVVGAPLLRRFGRRDDLPPGELLVIDGRLPAQDPGLDELGDTVQLVYADASELAAYAPTASSSSTTATDWPTPGEVTD